MEIEMILERDGDEKGGKALNGKRKGILKVRTRDFEIENQSQTDF
jgi:hypothetical protein